MTPLAIQLPEELKTFVERSVKTGLFSSASDYLVNLLYDAKAQSDAQNDADYRRRLKVLRAEISVGIEEADRGDFVEFTAEDVIAEAQRR